MARRSSWLVAVTIAAAISLLAGTALAAVSFDPTVAGLKVGGNYSWNYGNSLEAASSGGTDYLVALYATDFVKGLYATDTGPYQGVYVTRANAAGTPLSFSAPKRLNPATQHAERPTLAADGSTVLAGYVSQVSYDAYTGAGKRVFYVRRSADGGGTWASAKALSPLTGRVDYPVLAMSDGYAYAVWTDANTGNVRLRISADGGVNWAAATTVGTTTSDAGDGEGRYGYAQVAASGSNVAVGWFTDSAGRTVVRGSSNHGTSFGSELVLTATSPNDTIHYVGSGGQDDGAANRVDIAYTTGTYTTGKVAVREWNGATWSAEKTVLNYGDTVGGKVIRGSYGPAPLPYGASGIIVAFPGCQVVTGLTNMCDYASSKDRTSLLFEDTAAGTFADSSTVVVTASAKTRYINDSASVVTLNGTTNVLYNGWTSNYFFYRIFLKQTGPGPS